MTAPGSSRAVPLARRMISVTWVTLGLVALVTIAVGLFYPSVLIDALVKGGMWALMAAGLALVFGVMNIPNFAHGEFFMIGSFVAFTVFSPMQELILESHPALLVALGPLAAIAVATLVGAVVGVGLEIALFRPLRRRSREQWVMNTFLLTAGVSVILINGDQVLFGNEYRGITRYWDFPSLQVLGASVSVDRFLVFLLSLLTIALFSVFLRSTRTGRSMRAVSQDETGAQMVGIDLNRVFILTMGLSCALAALAGASLLFFIPSYPTVGVGPLYLAWYVVILAGLGNVQGAIIGGFIVALLQTLTAYFIGLGWVDVFPTVFIILILLFKPSGLFGSEVKGVWEQ